MFKRSWNYISSIGIQDDYDDILVKRITLFNQFSVIAIVIFLLSGINNFFLGDVFSAILIECLLLVCLVGFYLNKLQYHRFAITFLFATVTVAIFYFDSYSGINSGTYLFHFPLILALAFIFDMREDKYRMVIHFSIIICLLAVNIVTRRELFESKFLNDYQRGQMFMFNLFLSVSSVGFFVYLMVQNTVKENYLYIIQLEERRKSEEIVKSTLAEKNILISELHHRVKNNLAIISGLFSLRIQDGMHEEARSVLVESRDRVRSMALIHNLLYKSNSLTEVNFNTYATELIKEISTSYPTVANSVKTNTHINNVFLNVNMAIPCGLILNELLTNCYKHAFTDSSGGIIDITFEKNNKLLKMTVKDNGKGLPDDYNTKHSLGMTVIEALSEQLEGNFSFSNKQGTIFELNFKENSN